MVALALAIPARRRPLRRTAGWSNSPPADITDSPMAADLQFGRSNPAVQVGSGLVYDAALLLIVFLLY